MDRDKMIAMIMADVAPHESNAEAFYITLVDSSDSELLRILNELCLIDLNQTKGV